VIEASVHVHIGEQLPPGVFLEYHGRLEGHQVQALREKKVEEVNEQIGGDEAQCGVEIAAGEPLAVKGGLPESG
jgi:hypothetical protein